MCKIYIKKRLDSIYLCNITIKAIDDIKIAKNDKLSEKSLVKIKNGFTYFL